MKVCGRARATRWPPMWTSQESANSLDRRSNPPSLSASMVTTTAPRLWRVPAYSSPGFPRPTTIQAAGSPVRSVRDRRSKGRP